MLLAPVYRLFPGPVTLLIVQAGLLAVAVVPLACWAERALSRVAALAVGLSYGLSWGITQPARTSVDRRRHALGGHLPAVGRQRDAHLAVARASGYRVVLDEAGFLLLRQGSS